MEILVDHLTRMAAGYICVAGLDDSGKHVRPVLEGKRLPSSMLGRNGGPFSVGALVDLGPTTPVGSSPEIEDHLFRPDQVRRANDETDSLWARLFDNAEFSLTDIFGHDLRNERRGAVVPLGAGRCSLGTLQPGYLPRMRLVEGRARCLITDPELGELDLSVTDESFYTEQPDGWVVDDARLAHVERELRSGTPVLLSVGLGRPWPASNPMHWLQVNTIHLKPTVPNSDKTAYSLEEIRKTHPNAYAPWTDDEERLLSQLYRQGVPVEQITEIMGRQPGGIASRLRRLGLID